jgi:hypothetical protein
MVSNMISRAAVLLAASASVVSAGSAIIHNQCDFPVYLWSVSNTAGPMQELAANGGEYTEVYRNNPNGGGISMKIASDEAASEITQFEYTLEDADLWYDLSNINGYPFMEWGVTIIPSDDKCNEVICPAGIELCAAAYNTPTEDWATAMCPSTADMVVLLCSGANDTTPDTGASQSSLVASATSSKVSSSTVVSATSTVASTTSTTSSSSTSYTTTAPSTLATSTTDNGVVIQTTFVTQVVTVIAGASTSTTKHHTWTGRPSFTGFPKRHVARHAHRHAGHQV